MMVDKGVGCVVRFVNNRGLQGFGPLAACATPTSMESVRLCSSVALSHSVYEPGTLTYKPDLYMIHGMLGSKTNFRYFAKRQEIAEGRRVILADVRNHGESPWADDMSYSAMARDVVDLADQLGSETFSVIGHSMGGKIAMALALEYPDRVEQLVVADIAPIDYGGHVDSTKIIKAAVQIDPATAASSREIEAGLSEAIQTKSTMQFVMQNLRKDDTGTYKWRCNFESFHDNILTLSAFDVPKAQGRKYGGETLVVYGERSTYMDEDKLRAFDELFTDVTAVEIPDAGHWLHADNPKAFLQSLNDFLE